MSEGRQLNAAVIGLGFGANHARVLHELPGVRLAAVCDRDPDRLARAGAGRDLHTYTDHRQMLEAERLDAVVIAVPARLHEIVATDAVAAGCGVLVEKPLAPSLDSGRRIVAAARQAGVPLMPGHIERFNPAVQELLRRVRAGEAGHVLQMTASRLAYFADRTRDVDVGVIHDLAFHEIDVMRALAGADVERVFAEIQSGVLTPFDDAVSGLLRFEATAAGPGAVGSLTVHWLSPRKVRQLCVLGERGEFVLDYQEQTLTFQPTQHIDGAAPSDEAAPVSLRGAEPDPAADIPIEKKEPLKQELSAFLDAVRDGTPPPVTGEEALAALTIADALGQSGRTGLPVTLR